MTGFPKIPMPLGEAVALLRAVCDALSDPDKDQRGAKHKGVLDPHHLDFADASDGSKTVERITLPNEAEREIPEGAAPFVSPEAIKKEEATSQADVYCLGAMLYTMLCGEPPFVAANKAALLVKHVLERPKAPRLRRKEIPEAIEKLILSALGKAPAGRPTSPAAFKEAMLAAFAEAQKAPPAPAPMAAPPPAPMAAPPPAPMAAPPPAPMAAPPAMAESLHSTQMSFPAPGGAGPGASLTPAGMDLASTGYLPPQRRRMRYLLPASALIFAVAGGIALLSYRGATPDRNIRTASAPPIPIQAPPSEALERKSNAEAAKPEPQAEAPAPAAKGGRGKPVAPVRKLAKRSPARADDGGERELPGRISPRPAAPKKTPPPRKVVADESFADLRKSPPPPPPPPPPISAPGGGFPPLVEPAQPTAQPQEVPSRLPLYLSGAVAAIALSTCLFLLFQLRRRNLRRALPTLHPSPSQSVMANGPTLQAPVVPPLPNSLSRFDEEDTSATVVMQAPVFVSSMAYDNTFPAAQSMVTPTLEHGALRSPSSENEEMEPFEVGQYSCFARLGEGGMGMVYKARHRTLDRLSAVKVLLPGTSAQDDAIHLFRREAKLASSINHPNSVFIYDYGEVEGNLFYLAMEFLQGRSLADLIDPEDGPPKNLPLSKVLAITQQICSALDAAHGAGVIHRDLKPQNIMVCPRPSGQEIVKVVDFGIARSLTVQSTFQTMTGAVMGTPAYMSPEQALGQSDLDARSDIYSLGLLVYRMLSGDLPFRKEGMTPVQQIVDRALSKAPPPPIRSVHPELGIPPHVESALLHAMAVDRNDRPKSAGAFFEELAA